MLSWTSVNFLQLFIILKTAILQAAFSTSGLSASLLSDIGYT